MSTHVAINYVSPTQISTLLTCERKYELKYVTGLREPGSEATATGGGFAHALEFDDVEAGISEYLKRRPDVSIFDDEDERENERLVAVSTIRWAFEGYRKRHGLEDRHTRVRREETYVVDLPGGGVLLTRIDGVGDRYLVEDKLRSGSSLTEELVTAERERGHQLTAEVYAHWRRTGAALPVRLRCVRKPDRRKTKALKLDAAAIDAHVREWFATSDKAFAEYEVWRPVERLETFGREAAQVFARRQELQDGIRPAVRSPHACVQYGKMCAFASDCYGGQS